MPVHKGTHRLLGPLTHSKEFGNHLLLGRTYIQREQIGDTGMLRLTYQYYKNDKDDGQSIGKALLIALAGGEFESGRYPCKGVTYLPTLIYIPNAMHKHAYNIIQNMVMQYSFFEILDGTNTSVYKKDLPLDLAKHESMFITEVDSYIKTYGITDISLMNCIEKFNRLPIYKVSFWSIQDGMRIVDMFTARMNTNEVVEAPWVYKNYTCTVWPLTTSAPSAKDRKAKLRNHSMSSIESEKPVEKPKKDKPKKKKSEEPKPVESTPKVKEEIKQEPYTPVEKRLRSLEDKLDLILSVKKPKIKTELVDLSLDEEDSNIGPAGTPQGVPQLTPLMSPLSVGNFINNDWSGMLLTSDLQ